MKVKISRENLCLIYLMVMVACKAFGVNQADSIYFIAFGVGLFFLLSGVIIERWNKRTIFLFSFFIFISFTSYLFGKNIAPAIFIISIFGCINLNTEKIINVLSIEWIVLFAINISLCLLGVKDNQMQYLWSSTGIDGVAYCLGYGHKNQLSLACIVVMCSWLYTRYSKFKIFELITVDLLLAYILGFAKSSTGYLALAIINIFIILFRIKKIRIYLMKGIQIAFLFEIVFSLLLPIIYKSSALAQFVDVLLSTRIKLGNIALLRYGLSLFGTYVNEIVLDSLFMGVLIKNGILTFTIVIYLLCKTLFKLTKSNREKETICFFTMVLIGITEGAVLNPFINIFIILAVE